MTKKVKGIGFFKSMKALARARKNLEDISKYKTTDLNIISDEKAEFIVKFKEKGFKFKNGDNLKKIEKDISDIIGRKAIVKTVVITEKPKEKKERKKYEEINNPKKKGGVFTFLAGAAAGGVVKNKLSPPIITPLNPDDVVYKMEPSGFGWTVWTGKREGGRIVNRQSRRISRATVNMGGKFTVTWSN